MVMTCDYNTNIFTMHHNPGIIYIQKWKIILTHIPFMYIVNSGGPGIDPSGTPQLIYCISSTVWLRWPLLLYLLMCIV